MVAKCLLMGVLVNNFKECGLDLLYMVSVRQNWC